MPGLSNSERARVETTRRYILRVLHASSIVGTNEHIIHNTLQGERYPIMKGEVRRYLDYLEKKGLLNIEDRESEVWHAFISDKGIDIIEGTIPVPPGIARC